MEGARGCENGPTLALSLEEVATTMDRTVLLWGQAFQAASDLLPLVQCSLFSHERSSKTERDFERESRFTFRGAPDVIWR